MIFGLTVKAKYQLLDVKKKKLEAMIYLTLQDLNIKIKKYKNESN